MRKGEEETKVLRSYQIQLSSGFIAGSFAFVVAVGFIVGYSCRWLVANELTRTEPMLVDSPAIVRSKTLPPPVLSQCKRMPNFVYSSKHYETGIRATSDNMLVRPHSGVVSGDISDRADNGKKGNSAVCPLVDDDDEEEEHQPAGQHLLVDIKNVDGIFLNSEYRLAQAMVDLVQLSGLTMLSYHCHRLDPIGVSCIGVLLESHVSFHTWPIEGVILFDLFTCGPNSLVPLLGIVKELFAVPRPAAYSGGSGEEPHMNWSYKKRGFRDDANENFAETTDMNMFLYGWMEFDMKELVVELETEYQKVDIYDIINPRFRDLDDYKKSKAHDGSYQSQHPELYRPDRVVYLDHILQSRYYGEASYHESLVHPAMFAHANPRRVAIIGGGEGATLREVLKHNTIEKVTMIEIDEIMVNASRQYLPEWSSCGNLVGSADSCFEDRRAELIITDAIAWFFLNYGEGRGIDKEKFDVIIMDALDPSSVDFSDLLYDNDNFTSTLAAALTDDGILVTQVGEEDFIHDAPREYAKRRQEYLFSKHLEANGFNAIKSYQDAHGGFMGVWRYLIAFKNFETKANWYANQAEIDLQIRKRAMKTAGGVETPFRYFDGAAMMGYQYATRANEEVFCRATPKPPLCEEGHGLDPEVKNVPASSFEVRQSAIPNAGRGVFFKEAVPKGSYIAAEEMVHAILSPPFTTALFKAMLTRVPHDYYKTLNIYMFGYGFGHDFYGRVGYSVEPSLMTFVNHGCKGTNNMGQLTSVTEMTADPDQIPDELMYGDADLAVFNPFVDRNHWLHLHALDTTIRDVEAGEELVDNYLTYLTEENWAAGVQDYRAQCQALGVGVISQYETGTMAETDIV